MKIHRFYTPTLNDTDILNKTFEIKDNLQINQIANVLRIKPGSKIIIFNGHNSNEYQCEVKDINKVGVTLLITGNIKVELPSTKINVYMSLIKKDLVEDTIGRIVQLGATSFTPIITSRTESKNIHLSASRIAKLVGEATEQCGRADIMRINEILKLNEALAAGVSGVSYVFDISGNGIEYVDHDKHTASNGEVHIYFGPEGGWTVEELATFASAAKANPNFNILKLGQYTLRAETAVVAGVATIKSQL